MHTKIKLLALAFCLAAFVYIPYTLAQKSPTPSSSCTVVTGAPITGGALDASSYVTINGTKITGFTIERGDESGALARAINSLAGVKAKVIGRKLRIMSPRHISISVEGTAGAITGLGRTTSKSRPGACP